MYPVLSKNEGLFSIEDWELLSKYMGSSEGGAIEHTPEGLPYYRTEGGILQPVFDIPEENTLMQHVALSTHFGASGSALGGDVWEGLASLQTREPFLPEVFNARIEVVNTEEFNALEMQRLASICAVLTLLKELDQALFNVWTSGEYAPEHEPRVRRQLIQWLIGMARMSRFTDINRLMAGFNVANVSISMISTVLRTTYAVKIHVPEWVILLEKAKLKAMTEGTYSLLDGL